MICPKWLVQSSALGVVGVALVAVPFWMSVEAEDSSEEPRFQQTSLQQEHDIDSPRVVERAMDSTETAHRSAGQAVRNVRARQVRGHLVDTYEGPTCPRQFEIRKGPVIEENGAEDDTDDLLIDDALVR